MYGIEIIGFGKNRRYCVKNIVRNGTNPVDGKSYRTEEEAKKAAEKYGLHIIGIGDLWKLCEINERSI